MTKKMVNKELLKELECIQRQIKKLKPNIHTKRFYLSNFKEGKKMYIEKLKRSIKQVKAGRPRKRFSDEEAEIFLTRYERTKGDNASIRRRWKK